MGGASSGSANLLLDITPQCHHIYNQMQTRNKRTKQTQPNGGQQLKVIQPSLQQSILLQQQEQQALRNLSINRQIPNVPKAKANPKPKPNNLQAPYQKPTAKPATKPTGKPASRTVVIGKETFELPRDAAKLEAMKERELEWLRSLEDKL